MTEILEQLSEPLLSRSFDQAMKLAERTASYLETAGKNDRIVLEAADSTVYACETMRMTTQLMQVISWLLTQRAVMNGELSQVDSLDEAHRLGARSVCTAEPAGPLDNLPAALRDMLDEAGQLYSRVLRWEDMMLAEQKGAAANPVADMMNRLARETGDD